MLREGLGGVIAQCRIVHTEVDGVQAKSIDASLQPELEIAETCLPHFRVMAVEVRLAGQEIMQVVLPTPRFPLPGDTAEDCKPVGGRAAVGPGVGPDIPVRLVVVPVLAALEEPWVTVRGVAENLVDDDLYAPPMCLIEESVEVFQGTEQRVDLAIVAHIVAEVLHRRLEEGRNPDGVDSKRMDVVQPGGDARQIAGAVTVAIQETARIDLVNDSVAPPVAHVSIPPALQRPMQIRV